MVKIEHLFKKYGKKKIVNWINDYYSKRININMKVDFIIYTLDSYGYKKEIEEDYKNMSNYSKYTNFGEYFIR